MSRITWIVGVVAAVLMSTGGLYVVCMLPLSPVGINILGILPLLGGIVLGVWIAGDLGMFASYGPHSK